MKVQLWWWCVNRTEVHGGFVDGDGCMKMRLCMLVFSIGGQLIREVGYYYSEKRLIAMKGEKNYLIFHFLSLSNLISFSLILFFFLYSFIIFLLILFSFTRKIHGLNVGIFLTHFRPFYFLC